MNNIFIPKEIIIGFQNRNGTYTGKLAYIIYKDENGKLRKEQSWNSWRDKNIEPLIYKNTPMSGFVLNKKIGGYNTGWNHRQTYVRIYDSRGFEFEITVENLLYILENTSSIKGKGLEGEFVYGWDGKDLILIPISSPDYKEITEFNKILHNKQIIKAKDLIIGATYRTKQNQTFIYIGKFDYYSLYGKKCTGKYHWFYNVERDDFEQFRSVLDKLISIIDSDCHENYADIFHKMEGSYFYSPIDESKNEYIEYSLEEFKEKMKDDKTCWGIEFYANREEVRIYSDGRIKYLKGRSTLYTYGYREEKYNNLEELYNKIRPQYLNTYLLNGRLYREGK
ncbi:TPA: hypothetical protein KNP26_002927 [Clostridioides difficile]|nr:hypothetical protein [Clostridioides difficile]